MGVCLSFEWSRAGLCVFVGEVGVRPGSGHVWLTWVLLLVGTRVADLCAPVFVKEVAVCGLLCWEGLCVRFPSLEGAQQWGAADRAVA